MLRKRFIVSEGSIRSQQVIENTNNTQGMLPNNGGVAGVDNNIQVPTTVGDGSKIFLLK